MPRPSLHPFSPYSVALATLIALGAAFLLARPAAADWPSDPTVNVPVCTAANLQLAPVIAASSDGSAIIAWYDLRNGTDYDIYARRVLADGTLDPAWPNNGKAVCAYSGTQFGVQIVSDGSGGAIIAWADYRGGSNSDVYAQHVLSNGVLDFNWPTTGLPVCTAAGNQFVPPGGIVTDGMGGALVAWMDARVDTSVYVQHVLRGGEVDPTWPVNGLSVGAVADYSKYAVIVADGSGGAIATWPDHRSGSTFDIFAQHVLANGTLDPVWPTSGLGVCTAAGNQLNVDAIMDGSGGALVVWEDLRAGNADIYAHHVLANGVVDPVWPADGSAVCDFLGAQQVPRLVSDRSGGAIVAWRDSRVASDQNLYAQHILSSGVRDPGWAPAGQIICDAAGSQVNQALVSDGFGGAVITWDDYRAGASNVDIYSHHILSIGSMDADWPVNGRSVTSAVGSQSSSKAIADGSGGAIVTWYDARTFATTMNDIYAQRVQANGQLGGTVVGVRASGGLAFTLDPVRPNPSRGGVLSLGLSLPAESHVSVELLDVSGRMIARRDLGTLSPGHQSVGFEPPGTLGAGLYFVRVHAGQAARTARVAILH